MFFFRNDVWRNLTEPQLERLKIEMFRPRVKNSRGALDVVRWRLTLNEARVRMIMNLERRKLVEVSLWCVSVLGK